MVNLVRSKLVEWNAVFEGWNTRPNFRKERRERKTRSQPAADAILLPELKPRAVGQQLIVPSICGRDVAGAERPGVRHFEHLLQLLDVVDDSFNVHVQRQCAAYSNSIANRPAAPHPGRTSFATNNFSAFANGKIGRTGFCTLIVKWRLMKGTNDCARA
jgi:hypothetical protein